MIFSEISEKKASLLSRGVFLFLLAFFLFFGLIPTIFGQNKIPPRVFLGNNNLPRDIRSAEEMIRNLCEQYENQTTNLFFNGKRIQASYKELGLEIDEEKTVANMEKALEQKKTFLRRTFSWWLDLFWGYKVPVFYYFDLAKLEDVIQKKSKFKLVPAEDAKIRFEENKIVLEPAKEGIGVDGIFFVSQVIKGLKDWSNNDIQVNLIKIYPNISTAEAQKVKEGIDKLIAYPFAFRVLDYNFNLPRTVILSWIDVEKKKGEEEKMKFNGNGDEDVKVATNTTLSGRSFIDWKENDFLDWDINKEAVSSFLKKDVEGLVYREAQNGVLVFENGEIKEAKPSQSEISVDTENSADLIIDALKKGNYFIDLPIKKTPASVSLDRVKELKINTLLGVGESNFAGSPANRRHNIEVGASRFNGVVIDKDSEFSFLATLGPVDKTTGYLPELVIKKDKTVPEYGGGMCQVSSTSFRAAVNSGLRVTERQNHAYPVQYYSPQGTDATVYIPRPDLKFVNDTPGPILIQTRIEGNILKFEYFGISDGRKVELEGPRVWDKKPDGSMKAEWIQKVYDKDGKMLFQKNFFSDYDSPNKYPHPGDEKPPTESKKKKKKH